MRLYKILLLAQFAFTSCLTGCNQKANDHAISVAFYNCENFFDPADNPAKEDDEFANAA